MFKLLKLSGSTSSVSEASKVPAPAKRIMADAPHYTYPIWVKAVFARCGRPKNIVRVWAWNYGRPHETDVYCEVEQ